MTFTIDVDNIENNNFQLTENSDGDLVLEHKTSGATFDYDSTNDQWVASSGFSTPALETEDLTITNWRQPVVYTIYREGTDCNVMDANGSIVETDTDWGSAAQYAVDNLPETGETGSEVASGGGRIHTVAGDYDTSTEVVVPGNGKFDQNWYPVQFSGEGVSTTIRQEDNADLDAMLTFEVTESTTGHNHGVLSMRFEGNKDNNVAGDAAIRSSNPYDGIKINHMRFHDVTVLRFNGDGVNISDDINHAVVRDCLFEYCDGDGFKSKTNLGREGPRVRNCKSENNSGSGFDTSGLGSDNLAYQNGDVGIVLRANSNLSNCRAEENGQDGGAAEVQLYPESDFDGYIVGDANTSTYALSFFDTDRDSWCEISARGSFANGTFNNSNGNYSNQRNA